MHKQIVGQAKAVVVACLLLLSLLAFSLPAQAGKAPKALAFDGSNTTVGVAAIYETSYSTQKSTMKSLKLSSKSIKKLPGFKGAAVLQSQDGKQVVVFSQWQDLASYQATAAAPASDANKANAPAGAPVAPAPTRTVISQVVSLQASIPGSTPALRGKQAVVRLTHLTAKDPKDQAQLLPSIEAMVPELLAKQPIPQSVMVLAGLDGQDVSVLTNWNCSALFEDVGNPSPIEPGQNLLALSDSEQNFYDVVNILPTPVKKAEDQEAEGV